MSATLDDERGPSGHAGSGRFWMLAMGSVGVVFGDIGTSPLYAFREALSQAGGVTSEAVMGVVSLALWALILVVTVKYVLFLMRADNNGEGGVLSLAALAEAAMGRRTTFIFILGVTGAALFLRGCDHNAGDFRAVGGRGFAFGARLGKPRDPDDGDQREPGDPARPVSGAVAGYGWRRSVVRADLPCVVCRDRGHWRPAHPVRAARPAGDQSVPCNRLSAASRDRRLLRAGARCF